MADIIVIIIIAVIFLSALSSIIVRKKKGSKCIGCPEAGACMKRKCEAEEKK